MGANDQVYLTIISLLAGVTSIASGIIVTMALGSNKKNSDNFKEIYKKLNEIETKAAIEHENRTWYNRKIESLEKCTYKHGEKITELLNIVRKLTNKN